MKYQKFEQKYSLKEVHKYIPVLTGVTEYEQEPVVVYVEGYEGFWM